MLTIEFLVSLAIDSDKKRDGWSKKQWEEQLEQDIHFNFIIVNLGPIQIIRDTFWLI